MARESKRATWVKRVAAFERSGLSRRVWCADAYARRLHPLVQRGTHQVITRLS